ncbi:MAG: hypothetical protein FVQ85_08345 [Planctomycetes bacterium]|nr:hypothetical protein [Planctomycetota bacterium]
MVHKQKSGFLAIICLVLLANVMFFAASDLRASQKSTISLVTDSQMGRASQHGTNKLRLALQKKGIQLEQTTSFEKAKNNTLIVVGLSGGAGAVAKLHKLLDIPKPAERESLLIRHTRWSGKKTLLVSGADDCGLMYALLDVADRIGWADDPGNPLSEVRNTIEKPAVVERALSIYTMHKANFESYFYDENYWARYLDMLAENRFNTFALLFGYENWGYFSPPYPYFFDVEGFDDVKVVGITREKQQRNLEALNRIIKMTHDRGMNFTLGIWDHIYRGGVQGPRDRAGKPTEGIVWGLTAENLTDYTKAALTKLLGEVHDINAIQFRMHGESGLKRNEMGGFWENIYKVMTEHAPDIRFDARAKNFPDSLIDKAVEMGVNMRICTKYWMEQMGLPFHPTHIHPGNQHDRRHGYADLLSYPQRYKMHWRLWNCGTTRVLLWGDPDYVRRFVQSTYLYDGEGFEVVEPMATKMQDHPLDIKPFELLKPQYKYYDWEFERYWHFFQFFGRLGYNPDTPSDVWQSQFQMRFGKEAAPYIEQALHRAGKILPRIVAYNYPYNMFPTTRGWVEKQRMKDLPEYSRALPSDTQQFLSMDNAAQYQLEGKESARIWPQESSRWFARISRDVLSLAGQAERRIGRHRNKEFDSTIVDLKILAYLALYHSHRAKAGFSYALFKHSKDLNALDDAIGHEGQAIEAWEKIAEAAGDVYNDNLMMGRERSGLSGHWKDELAKLKQGLNKLIDQRDKSASAVTKDQLSIAHVPIRRIAPANKLLIRATVTSKAPVTSLRLAYRNAKNDYKYLSMERTEPFLYRAKIPKKHVKKGLNYYIEAADKRRRLARTKSIEVIVTKDNKPPLLKHKPITNAPAAKPLIVTADVDDPSGVKWVRLRYRSVSQYQDYKTLNMRQTRKKGHYEVVVPGKDIPAKWDFMYLFEVMDEKGNGKIYPDLETEAPYIVVKLQR